ncbi:MAG: cupin domain-containing protein [Janthinobacterium lividum]
MRALLIATALVAAPATAQTVPDPTASDPTGFATGADIRAQIAAMERDMKPGQGFAWRPLVRDGQIAAAIEIWRAPGKPAVHPAQAEYTTVLSGTGTLISGGRLADPYVSNPDLTEGSRIEGGTTRPLKPGDVLLVPAGVPHWFGITGGELVLLGTKIPQAAR